MTIIESLKALTKDNWQALSAMIDYHGGVEVVEWFLRELNNKNAQWMIVQDFFNQGSLVWFLVASKKEFLIASSENKQDLIELAAHYGKEVEIDE